MQAFKAHRSVFIASLLVAAVYASHNFFIPHFLGNRTYYPVTTAANRDEGMFYGQRVAAAYFGQWKAGDINVAENSTSPSLLPLLNPLLIALPAKILGSLKAGFIFADIFYPALIFIAIYFLTYELAENRSFALIFSVIFIFSPKLGIFPSPDALPFFTKLDELYFSRFEYPEVTFLFFALGFYFLLRALKRDELLSRIFAGIFFGLMFYTYLYDWAYFFTGLGILAGFFILGKDREKLKKVLQIGAIGFCVSIFYWMNFLQLHALPQYHDLFRRIGTEVGREFRIWTVWKSYLRILFLVGLLWFTYKKTGRLVFQYISAFLLAYFVVVNVQVLTGFNPQPDHWYRISFLPIDLGIFAIFVWLLKNKLAFSVPEKYMKAAGYSIVALIFSLALFSQYLYSNARAQSYTVDENYAKSYDWLNANTPTGSVVGSIAYTNTELGLNTHNKLFLANGFNSTVSNEEIWRRAMETGALYGLSSEEFVTFSKSTMFNLFHAYYRDNSFDSFFTGNTGSIVQESVYAEKESEYKTLAKNFGIKNINRRLDYIYFGPREKESGKDPARTLKGLKKAYDEGGVIIYALK